MHIIYKYNKCKFNIIYIYKHKYKYKYIYIYKCDIYITLLTQVKDE